MCVELYFKFHGEVCKRMPQGKLCNRRMQKMVETQKKKLVMSCLHLVCKGKGRIPVSAVRDLASHGRGVRSGTDLYIQTEPKPDCCESHLLQNKSLIRLWAPKIPTGWDCRDSLDSHRDLRHCVSLAWYRAGECRQPQKCLSNALETQTEMVGCWQNFSLGKINSLDCRSESHLPANLPSVSHMYTFSSMKRKSHLLLIASMRLSGLLFSWKGPFSFPLSSSLALPHAAFPSCSLSWYPLVLPNSSLSHIFQICHCPFLIFHISPQTPYVPICSFPQKILHFFSDNCWQPVVVATAHGNHLSIYMGKYDQNPYGEKEQCQAYPICLDHTDLATAIDQGKGTLTQPMFFPAMALPQSKINCTITETWPWECPSIDIQNAKELHSYVKLQTDAILVQNIFSYHHWTPQRFPSD